MAEIVWIIAASFVAGLLVGGIATLVAVGLSLSARRSEKRLVTVQSEDVDPWTKTFSGIRRVR